MAVNVVIALAYYLRWTALLFRGAEAPEAVREDTSRAVPAVAAAGTAPAAAPAPSSPRSSSPPPPRSSSPGRRRSF